MDGLERENLIKMDELGVPLFQETPISEITGHTGHAAAP